MTVWKKYAPLGSYGLNQGRMQLDRPIHCLSFSWVPLKVQRELCENFFERVLLYWSIQCPSCHLYMDDRKNYVGSVIPSPLWHNCIWYCTLIGVESTSWIVLLLEKHMNIHIDSVGSVTFVGVFSKNNKHLY